MAHGATSTTLRFALHRVVAALAGAFVLVGATGHAQPSGDDASFVRKVNDIYKGRDRAVPDARRADLRLFPAAMAMAAPPASAATPLLASLLSPGASGWPEAEGWAKAEAQRAVLDAVREIGDASKRFAFLHGYGREAAPREWVEAGLYVDLGEPPILAAAQFRYFGALERIGALVNIEATRLVREGKGKESAELLVRWIFFGRALADREFFAEKRMADVIMRSGLERLRDLVYTDPEAFTDTDIRDVIGMIQPRQVMLERLHFPRADRIAAEQALARAYTPGGGPSPERFGPTFARIASSDRPLMMFGESARWQSAATGLAGTYDTSDELDAVYDDWLYRWDLAYFDDIIVQRPSDYDVMDKAKFAVIDRLVGPAREMFPMRQRLDTDFAGTRMALGVAAFARRFNLFPDGLAAIRPGYVQRIETDPYTREGADFHYFVPMRGQRVGPRETPTPHTIRVALPGASVGDEHAAHNAEVDRIVREVMDATGEFVTELNKIIAEQTRVAQRRVPEIVNKYSARMKQIGESINKETHAALDALWNERGQAVSAQRMQELERRGAGSSPLSTNEVLASVGQAMRVALRIQAGGFERDLDDGVFVLYSVGPTGQRNWARSVGEDGEDLLYWPPLLSLVRDEIAKTGESSAGMGAWFDYTPAQRFQVALGAHPGDPKQREQTEEQAPEPTSSPARDPVIPF